MILEHCWQVNARLLAMVADQNGEGGLIGVSPTITSLDYVERLRVISSPAEFNDKAIQILQGAMQEFLRNGYAGTSMDKVAATAGVSKPTVYNYFQDKEGLFKALVRFVARARCQKVLEDLQGPPQQVIRRVATTAIEGGLNDTDYLDFVRLVAGESGRFPQLAQAFLENLTKPSVDQLTNYLKQHPELKLPDPEATARILMGSTVFFMLTQGIMHGDKIMPMEPERLVDGLVHLLMRGMDLKASVSEGSAE